MKDNRQVILAGLTSLVVLTGALLFFAPHDQSLQRLQRSNTIRIGYALEAPYSFRVAGEVTGEFPEMARLVVAELGIRQIEWIQTDFDLLITELEAGRFDVIAAGMYITKARAARVAFSTPLLHTQQGLLVRTGNPKRIYAYQQAYHEQMLKFAVIAGSIEEVLLPRIGLLADQIVVVPDARTGRTAVESGLVDGLALTSPTIRWMARHEGLDETTVAQPFIQPPAALMTDLNYCAFAFRKADQQLLAAWNNALQPLINSEAHLQLIEQFGFTQAELPGRMTTEEILAQ